MEGNNYYIFIVYSIRNIGGMQLYVSRKVEYLKTKNWIPIVFYIFDGEIRIENLKEYKSNLIPELRFAVGNVPERVRNNVYIKIKEKLKNPQKIVIESSNLIFGTWGEYLASKFNGKHILYVIDESISPPTKSMKAFINFKMQQNLFFCISAGVIKNFFSSHLNFDKYILPAIGCSSNNVANIKDERVDSIPDNENTILSIGNLFKPYINHLFESIAEFAKSYIDVKFNLIIIGDTPSVKYKKQLLNQVTNIPNINIYDLGHLWPIPISIFKKAKVAVGTAGSIRICYRQGVPSISIDSRDHEAIGILGYNTDNGLFRDSNDTDLTIIDYLKTILIDNQVQRKQPEADPPLDYWQHQLIIDRDWNGSYYPTEKSKKLVSLPCIRSYIIKICLLSTSDAADEL